jgi:hypothetical protein
MAAKRKPKSKVKKGSVINGWIVEEELTSAGPQPGGLPVQAMRVGREHLSGYVLSHLHSATPERFAITGEDGDWVLQRVESVDWAMVRGEPGRRIYRLRGMALRSGETVADLVQGL